MRCGADPRANEAQEEHTKRRIAIAIAMRFCSGHLFFCGGWGELDVSPVGTFGVLKIRTLNGSEASTMAMTPLHRLPPSPSCRRTTTCSTGTWLRAPSTLRAVASNEQRATSESRAVVAPKSRALRTGRRPSAKQGKKHKSGGATIQLPITNSLELIIIHEIHTFGHLRQARKVKK